VGCSKRPHPAHDTMSLSAESLTVRDVSALCIGERAKFKNCGDGPGLCSYSPHTPLGNKQGEEENEQMSDYWRV
jgi:hypothetical protein